MPWCRRLVPGLSSRKSGFDPAQSICDYWYTKWHWTGFTRSTSVSPVSVAAPMLHVHLHPDIHVVRRTGGRSL